MEWFLRVSRLRRSGRPARLPLLELKNELPIVREVGRNGVPCVNLKLSLRGTHRGTELGGNVVEYAIGVVGAVAVGLFASVIGFDKDRSFYPVVLIVIAALYLLFAVMAGSASSLISEAVPALVFMAMAAIGFCKTPWLVVAGLALHGVFDFFHHAVIANPGVPAWWPGWCLAYDVLAAAYLATLIMIRRPAHMA